MSIKSIRYNYRSRGMLSVCLVCFSCTIPQVQCFIISYYGFRFTSNIVDELWLLTEWYFITRTRNTFCRTRSLSDATFHCWSRDVHLVQNVLWCTEFHRNRMIFMRYGDITIFKMAAVRHLGIVLPPYKTTHEVSVAGRSCQSNFMSMWYTDLKIW